MEYESSVLHVKAYCNCTHKWCGDTAGTRGRQERYDALFRALTHITAGDASSLRTILRRNMSKWTNEWWKTQTPRVPEGRRCQKTGYREEISLTRDTTAAPGRYQQQKDTNEARRAQNPNHKQKGPRTSNTTVQRKESKKPPAVTVATGTRNNRQANMGIWIHEDIPDDIIAESIR
jgi:hypothetical protein